MNIVECKAKARHEMVELLTVLMFLAPFLLAFAIFRHYVEGSCGKLSFSYAAALAGAFANAVVLSKVILIGEIAKVGKSSEEKSLILATMHKAGMFTVFYLMVHVGEATVRSFLLGQGVASALEKVLVPGDLLAISLVVFFAFIPFFALRELRRVIGIEEFRCLFLNRDADSC